MILHEDPERMAEPPPASPLDALRLAAVIARPALRLATIAAALLLVALLFRVGASPDPFADRAWGLALAGLAALGLFTMPRRLDRDGGALLRRAPNAWPHPVAWSDRALVAAARRWAYLVVLLATASLAMLVATLAAGSDTSTLLCGIGIAGMLAARSVLVFAPSRPASPVSRAAAKHVSFVHDASVRREQA